MKKYLLLLSKVLIIISSLVYAGFIFFAAQVIASPTGLFGNPNTSIEQFVGITMIIVSLAILIVSIIVFSKKNILFFYILIILPFVQAIMFAFIEGFDNENTLFSGVYIIVILFLFNFYSRKNLLRLTNSFTNILTNTVYLQLDLQIT